MQNGSHAHLDADLSGPDCAFCSRDNIANILKRPPIS